MNQYPNDWNNIEEESDELNPKQCKRYGMARIAVHFTNRVEWQKWRKYILKTNWDFDDGMPPYLAHLNMYFNCYEDVEEITKQIVNLLQMGFDVYSCKWELLKENQTIIEKNGVKEIVDLS